jgi:hypothetical protein
VPAESQSQVTPSVRVETTLQPERTAPSWFTQLAIITLWFKQHAMLPQISAALQLVRRVDAIAAIDVVILMLVALVANRPIAAAVASLDSFCEPLAALWNRKRLSSRSAASRFLSALSSVQLDNLQSLFCPPFVSTVSRRTMQEASSIVQIAGLSSSTSTERVRRSCSVSCLTLTGGLLRVVVNALRRLVIQDANAPML